MNAQTVQLAAGHMQLLREAAQALHGATDQTVTSAQRGAAVPAWQGAAERLAVALIARLEAQEVCYA